MQVVPLKKDTGGGEVVNVRLWTERHRDCEVGEVIQCSERRESEKGREGERKRE